MIPTTTTTVYSPADLAYFKALAALRWHDAVARYQEERSSTRSSSSSGSSRSVSSSISSSAVSARSSGINWDCVATAETGGNWHMVGSMYSTALGILNEAVRENASPAVAAQVFAGTASRAEQVAIAESIVRKFGFHAWAPSTVRKCS